MDEPLTRVMALHALAYCERLFYLEEVEEIRIADAAVYAGRTLHTLREEPDPTATEHRRWELTSERLGLTGVLDAARQRDGQWIPIEHKKGRSRRADDGSPEAWDSDRLQAIAYAALLEDHLQEPVSMARIRYHADGASVAVTIDDAAKAILESALSRARDLRATTQRPPVANNPNLCTRCSLAPVCLPEEGRLSGKPEGPVRRLFPEDTEKSVLHVRDPGSQVGRSGPAITISAPDQPVRKVPAHEVQSVVLHGGVTITGYAMGLCAYEGIPVHWISRGGRYQAGTAAIGGVQRRIRQFSALTEPGTCLYLARRLAHARVESQIRYLLRASRSAGRSTALAGAIQEMRTSLRAIPAAETLDSVRGYEGAAGRAYFSVVGQLVRQDALRPDGRTRRPPRDPFNALLSFGYSLLMRAVMDAIVVVGLDPAFGFFHTPRSAAHPLALDLMELFRVSLVDQPVIASINRGGWDPATDFEITTRHVWLSDAGRDKAIALFESRLHDSWKHPVLNYSLTYGRMIELEVRLLEKEWTGEPGLFARSRPR